MHRINRILLSSVTDSWLRPRRSEPFSDSDVRDDVKGDEGFPPESCDWDFSFSFTLEDLNRINTSCENHFDGARLPDPLETIWSPKNGYVVVYEWQFRNGFRSPSLTYLGKLLIIMVSQLPKIFY